MTNKQKRKRILLASNERLSEKNNEVQSVRSDERDKLVTLEPKVKHEINL